MAISLKEQLRILQEGIHYHAPRIQINKSGYTYDDVREKSTQLFYDFYAMALMHRQLGSPLEDPYIKPGDEEPFDIEYPPEGTDINPNGEEDFEGGRKLKTARKLTPRQAVRYRAAVERGADPLAAGVANWADVELGDKYVPAQLRKVIDQVYDEVTIQLANKLMAHLRGSILQEFRYLIRSASDWKKFRQKLISIYHSKGTIDKADFDHAIKTNIPGMRAYPDVVMRLLKFCRYYDEMFPDPADIATKGGVDYPSVEPNVSTKKGGEIDLKKIDPRTEPLEPDPTEPLPMPGDEEPDDTDYNAEPVDIPPGADWDEDDWEKYRLNKESIGYYLNTKQKLFEGVVMHPSEIARVQKAILKSGVTWNDIALANNNLNWSGTSIGGPRWGEGAKSLIKLAFNAKLNNVEEMTGLIDHIYDLQHNNGTLLNKGGMYVAPEDLDRRSKITHLARFIPHVSPLVRRLILRVLGYVSDHPEIEKNIDAITQSPIQPFPPELQEKLTSYKFAKSPDGDSWISECPYMNKKDQTIQNEYRAKFHTNGMYSVEDTIKADIQVFHTWEEFETWLERMKSLLIKPIPGVSYYSPVKEKTDKQAYLEKRTKVKLDADKEAILASQCNMAWQSYNQYYLASFVNGDAFEFYAFSDGSFMGCMKSTKKIGGVFNTWYDALAYCKVQTQDAVPLSPSSIPTPPKPAAPTTDYTLNINEITALQILASKYPNISVQTNVVNKTPSGMTWFRIATDMGTLHDVLGIGKQPILSSGVQYAIKHVLKDGTEENWTFYTWNSAYSFISTNLESLINVDSAANGNISMYPSTTPFEKSWASPLPPPSPSKASYKAHLGINKPPTHTIRLTQEDEELLKNAGFNTKMQGSDVWYINDKVGDIVKFYPNDTAKIMFTKTNKGVVVTKKIEDAISWIVSKYTGASVSPIVKPAAPSTAGSKAGAMFEKFLNEAGFVWNPNTSEYFNNVTGSRIKVYPFPQSTFISGQTGQTKTFKNLPEMAMFLKKLGSSGS